MISPKICHCIHPFFRNYAPVSTPSSDCIGYSVIKDTVSSYCTKYTMCHGLKSLFHINVTICQVSVQQKYFGQETKFILFRLLVPFLFEAVRMVERGDAKPEVLFKSAYASKIKLYTCFANHCCNVSGCGCGNEAGSRPPYGTL